RMAAHRVASPTCGGVGSVRGAHVDDLSVDAVRKRIAATRWTSGLRRRIRRALSAADHLPGGIDATGADAARRVRRRRQSRFLCARLATQKTAKMNHVATSFRCACTLIRTPSPMNSEIIAV